MDDDKELIYCDLDPTKVCDNCCRCIDSGKDYEDFEIELTDAVYTPDEMADLLFAEDGDEDGYRFDSSNVAPIDIDPALKEEWERRLRVAEIADAQRLVKNFHGSRRIKRKE